LVRFLVDGAHGTGTMGPGGRGAVAEAGVEDGVDVIVGTLGKALGSYGAYAACDQRMARYLVNAARSFVFSTAPPPPAIAGALAALTLLEEEPRRVEKLRCNLRELRGALAQEGFALGEEDRTPIVPLVLGDAKTTMRACELALERGVFAQGIRPPTVPVGGSRLRLALMATHGKGELRDAARALAQAVRSAGMRPEELRPPVTAPVAEPLEAEPAPVARWDDERPRARASRPFDAELDDAPRRVFDAREPDAVERAA
jgi:glycine C-acetyltransferase/8-amino-7-oxononanoate synthase